MKNPRRVQWIIALLVLGTAVLYALQVWGIIPRA